MSGSGGFLQNAYGLDGSAKTQDYYRRWADTYEAEMRDNGYATPTRTAAAMAAHVSDTSAPFLDLGCGTGLSGEALRAAGFKTIDGSDFSAEMLELAAGKNVYRKLTRGDLNDPIPAKAGDYDNIAAIGVFSPGHAPPQIIAEVIGLLPGKGCFGFSLNDHALEDDGYENTIEQLASDGVVAVAFCEYGDHLPGHWSESKDLRSPKKLIMEVRAWIRPSF